MAETFLGTLRNIARGNLSYRQVRHQIFQAAQRLGHGGEYDLTDFLRDKVLKLNKDHWFALAFDDKDWKALDAMRGDRAESWAQLYLPLLLDYVTSNAAKVSALVRDSRAIDETLFRDDGASAQAILASLAPEDQQSVFAFRVLAAQFSYDAEALTAMLRGKLKTDWLRKRYLYPLVYQAFATPSQEGLDDFLSFVVTGEEPEAERATLRFLLRDDLMSGEPLAFKCYVALLCHPYDAYEILLNHIEEQVCQTGKLAPRLVDVLSRLHADVPSSRTKFLLRTGVQHDFAFADEIDLQHLAKVYGFSPHTIETIARIATTKSSRVEGTEIDQCSRPEAALLRMRTRQYPVPEDFGYLVNTGRSWWFCEAGRLLNSLMTSMYMLQRGDPAFERRDLLRLAGFLGNLTPFVLSSPSMRTLASDAFSDLWRGHTIEEFEALADREIRPAADYDDRMWIKAAHWMLLEPERQMQISKWLMIVREQIGIAPGFLTGIDWTWLDKVIRASRLAPFYGDPDGLFTLLLFKIEERDRRAGALRTAIEPIVEGKTLPEVVDWLIDEFGPDAVAFARYLLEVDDLLWLGLAPNRTAALAGRIYALERCVRQFKYTDLLPEQLFRQEWETLNSALMLSSVNAGQFEIPWSVFVRDAAARQRDLYTAAHSLEPTDVSSALLASSRVTMPYRFRNNRAVTYVYAHRLAPLVALIIAVIEDFLAHPAFGLEMILSTRFRHDTMRREFAAVLENVAMSPMHLIHHEERSSIIEAAEKGILGAVDDWLDERMHSVRPGKPNGLFDLIPSADEMVALAESLQITAGVDAVIGDVVGWIRDRLDHQLPVAREIFEAEMPINLKEQMAAEKVILLESKNYRPASVERVLAAAEYAVQRRTIELVEWFRADPEDARPPLTFGEVKAAADGLFEAFKERRGYRTSLADPQAGNRPVSKDKVRTVFDLLREVFASALEHTLPYKARVRMQPITFGGRDGFLFSNLTAPIFELSSSEVSGDPYESLNDVIFREGESGLAKIASIAATLVGKTVTIQAVRRGRSFHLFVPLWHD